MNGSGPGSRTVTIHLRYVIDPYKTSAFEDYARRWIVLVDRLGGQHLGYFMPSEGASNIAYALFSFPSLAAYENYREQAATDPDCAAAMKLAEESRCIFSFERTFLRPLPSASSRSRQ